MPIFAGNLPPHTQAARQNLVPFWLALRPAIKIGDSTARFGRVHFYVSKAQILAGGRDLDQIVHSVTKKMQESPASFLEASAKCLSSCSNFGSDLGVTFFSSHGSNSVDNGWFDRE